MSKEYAERQFLCCQMQAMYRHAEIVSGAYKLRGSRRGRENTPEEIAAGDTAIKFRDKTDEEKLHDSMSIMQRQIERMQEIAEHIEMLKEE